MNCSVCSADIRAILVEPDNEYICAKFPEIPKSSSGDSCCDIITISPFKIDPRDIRILFCYTVSLSIITLGNNTLHNCFVGVSAIKDGSHLCLRVKDDEKKYLTQMVQLSNSTLKNGLFALAFKQDDNDKLYYVKSTGIGQPLVIDSTIDPPFIFTAVIPAGKTQHIV